MTEKMKRSAVRITRHIIKVKKSVSQSQNEKLEGFCQCCLSENDLKSLLQSYVPNETYAEMIKLCFSIELIQDEENDVLYLICEKCISKLKICYSFRKEIEEVQLKLKKTIYNMSTLEDPLAKSEPYDPLDISWDAEYLESDGNHNDNITKSSKATASYKYTKKEAKNSKSKHLKSKITNFMNNVKPINNHKIKLENNGISSKIPNSIIKSIKIVPSKPNPTPKNIIKSRNAKSKNELEDKHSKESLDKSSRVKSVEILKNFNKREVKDMSNLTVIKAKTEPGITAKLECDVKETKPAIKKMPKCLLDKSCVVCDVCKEEYPTHRELLSHMVTHFPNYVCHTCGKAFLYSARLKLHLASHADKKITCEICNVSLKAASYKKHMIRHTGVKESYSCRLCSERYTSHSSRMQHMFVAHGIKRRRYQCKFCPKHFSLAHHRSAHIRRDHLQERNKVCSECGMAFFLGASLKLHMKRHRGERNFPCEYCLKCFYTRYSLSRHMESHNKGNDYSCNICEQIFTQKTTLKTHLKVHHDEDD